MAGEKFLIHGGMRLEGQIAVSGGKNAAVAIIPAALLGSSPSVIENLPDIPKQYFIVNDPTKQTITIVERPITPVTELQAKPVKIKRWLFNFNSAVQFSMVYISDNWYQGGQSSLSLLSDQLLSLKYNDPSGKVLFENALQWKV